MEAQGVPPATCLIFAVSAPRPVGERTLVASCTGIPSPLPTSGGGQPPEFRWAPEGATATSLCSASSRDASMGKLFAHQSLHKSPCSAHNTSDRAHERIGTSARCRHCIGISKQLISPDGIDTLLKVEHFHHLGDFLPRPFLRLFLRPHLLRHRDLGFTQRGEIFLVESTDDRTLSLGLHQFRELLWRAQAYGVSTFACLDDLVKAYLRTGGEAKESASALRGVSPSPHGQGSVPLPWTPFTVGCWGSPSGYTEFLPLGKS
jgi:hypothetical protein